MREQDDNELIKLSLAGDRGAFDILVGRYYDDMYKLAYRYCRDQGDAEDIVHNAFIKMAENLKKFRYDAAFKTWLYRIVINAANDWCRQKSRLQNKSVALYDISVREPGQEQELYLKEVFRKVQALPEGEKDALLLVAGEGLSHAAAAKILGCKESTISWRIHEARKKLKAMLEKDTDHG